MTYTLDNFEVKKEYDGWRILSHHPYYTSNACMTYENLLPEELGTFDSFINAVRFLKEWHKDLY